MPPKNIRVCCGRTCGESNPERLMSTLEYHFKTAVGNVTAQADLDYRGCTDYCELGPNVVVDNKIYHHSKPKNIVERIEKDEGVEMSKPKLEDLHLDDDLLL